MKALLLAALAAALFATPALACSPLISTDPVTGETVRSGTPEWDRREQADWRARSETVALAQVREGRLQPNGDIAFVLAPIAPVYDGALPESELSLDWSPGNTCNRFSPNLGDIVVAYVGADRSLIGLIVPEQLQDRPAGFGTRVREVRRGMIRPNGESAARTARSGPELLTAAEQSFSAIPFGAKEPPEGLTLVDRDDCEKWGECTWRDANGVEHYWEDELVVKSLDIAAAGDRPVEALGIGSARSQEDVVERVRRFLPETKITCDEIPEQGGTTYVCSAMLGEGWITLRFDHSHHLTEARIDAYHFT